MWECKNLQVKILELSLHKIENTFRLLSFYMCNALGFIHHATWCIKTYTIYRNEYPTSPFCHLMVLYEGEHTLSFKDNGRRLIQAVYQNGTQMRLYQHEHILWCLNCISFMNANNFHVDLVVYMRIWDYKNVTYTDNGNILEFHLLLTFTWLTYSTPKQSTPYHMDIGNLKFDSQNQDGTQWPRLLIVGM